MTAVRLRLRPDVRERLAAEIDEREKAAERHRAAQRPYAAQRQRDGSAMYSPVLGVPEVDVLIVLGHLLGPETSPNLAKSWGGSVIRHYVVLLKISNGY